MRHDGNGKLLVWAALGFMLASLWVAANAPLAGAAVETYCKPASGTQYYTLISTATCNGTWGDPLDTEAHFEAMANQYGQARTLYCKGNASAEVFWDVFVSGTPGCGSGYTSVTAAVYKSNAQSVGVNPVPDPTTFWTGSPPTVVTAPSVPTAQPVVGTVVTETAGAYGGSPAPTVTRQWERCNSAGASCANISGATSGTYTPVAGDVGSTLVVAG